MLAALLLVVLAPLTASKPSVRFYLGGGRVEENVAFVRSASRSVTGAYLCCHTNRVLANGSITVTTPPDSLVQETEALLEAGLEDVWYVVGIDQESVQNGTWRAAGSAGALAEFAASTKAAGLVVDYEPSTNYSQAHAEAYGAFLRALHAELQKGGRSAGMDFAGWGILNKAFWHAYTGIGLYTSMTPTYSGKNLTEDVSFVKEALSGATLSPSRVSFGVGTELISSCPSHQSEWHYNWTEAKLRTLVTAIEGLGGQGLDFWRTDIDHYCDNGTAPWMLDLAADFLESKRR